MAAGIPKGVPKSKHSDCIRQASAKSGSSKPRNAFALCNWALTGGPGRRASGGKRRGR